MCLIQSDYAPVVTEERGQTPKKTLTLIGREVSSLARQSSLAPAPIAGAAFQSASVALASLSTRNLVEVDTKHRVTEWSRIIRRECFC